MWVDTHGFPAARKRWTSHHRSIKVDVRGALQEAKACFSNVGKSEQNSSLQWGILHNYLLILRWLFLIFLTQLCLLFTINSQIVG